MSKWIKYLMTLVVGSVAPYAGALDQGCFEFSAAYRHDDASWNFKAPHRTPFIVSNIRFDDVHIFQLGASARGKFDCAYVRADAHWGWICDGDFKESLKVHTDPTIGDLFGPQICNRANSIISAHSYSILDGKYVADVGAAIGYPFYFCNCTLQLIPVIGYAYREQNYRSDQNERIRLDEVDDNVTPTSYIDFRPSCDVDYKFVTRWWGPFIGIDLWYDSCDCWDLYASFEAHWAHFKGIRQTRIGFCLFDEFSRSSHDAHGYVFRIGGEYEFCDCWYFGINATFEDWNGHTSNRTGNFSIILEGEGGEGDLTRQFADEKYRSNAKIHSYAVGFSIGRRF